MAQSLRVRRVVSEPRPANRHATSNRLAGHEAPQFRDPQHRGLLVFVPPIDQLPAVKAYGGRGERITDLGDNDAISQLPEKDLCLATKAASELLSAVHGNSSILV